ATAGGAGHVEVVVLEFIAGALHKRTRLPISIHLDRSANETCAAQSAARCERIPAICERIPAIIAVRIFGDVPPIEHHALRVAEQPLRELQGAHRALHPARRQGARRHWAAPVARAIAARPCARTTSATPRADSSGI